MIHSKLKIEMKKHFFLILVFLFTSLCSYNQYFTVEDIETGRKSYLKPADYDNLQWSHSAMSLVFSHGDSLFEKDIKGKDKHLLLDLNQLNDILSKYNKKALSAFPSIRTLSKNRIAFLNSTDYYVFDLEKKDIDKLFELPSGSENASLSPDTKHLCFTCENNVWIQDESGNQFQITRDSIDGITNGEIVYRNEFGIKEGIFWSPQGSRLAFYRRDQTQVSKYPLIDYNTKIAETKFIRYPLSGMKSEETDVLVYSIEDKSVVKLQVKGDHEQYLTNLSWTPDEKSIYLQQLNREQDRMKLKSYSAQTGALISELFTETDDRYIEPLNSLAFSMVSPGDFFYQSEKSGYNHLYYYNSEKETLESITEGSWEVTEFLGFDESEHAIYFMATKEGPLENHCYRLTRDNMEITRLTNEEGSHEVIFNKNMSYFIDRFSNYTVPNKILVSKNDGELVHELLVSDNPIEDYSLGKTERGTILAADDSTELYYRLIKPTDFDPEKKYPLLIYVYGGSHVQLLTNSWLDRIEYFQQYMAQHGFISFTLDCRGSDNRGKDFEDIVYRQLGIPQLDDQMAGVNYLKSLPYIDTNRIGVHGWSFGGYMTISMMLKYPDVFKTGVAGGPVIDWRYYEVMYTERYMDKPSENIDGYNKSDLKNYADKLAGDLLIIHGVQDPVVIWQQSILFLQACIDADVFVDYFIYPGQEHNVAGEERVYLTRQITNYFIEHLSH